MPANLSVNKVRVTKLFSASEPVGLIDPVVNMYVKYGQQPFWVKSVNADKSIVNLALASGGAIARSAYPHDLTIDYPTASGYWGFTDGSNGSVWHPRHISRSPVGVASGVVLSGGDGATHSYGI